MEYTCQKCGLIWYSECKKCHSLNIGSNLLTGVRCLHCGSYEQNNECPSCGELAKKPLPTSKCSLVNACLRARGEREADSYELKLILDSHIDIKAQVDDTEFENAKNYIAENSYMIVEAIKKRDDASEIFDELYYNLVVRTANKLQKKQILEALENYVECYRAARKKFLKPKQSKANELPSSVTLSNCKIVDGELIFLTKLRELCKRTFGDYGVLIKKAVIAEGIEEIKEQTFYSAAHMTSIVLPSTLKRIEYGAFANCRSLEEISIPKGLKYLGCCLFSNCYSLTKLNLGSYEGDIISNSFGGNMLSDQSGSCLSLKEIIVDKANMRYKSIDGVLFSKDEKTLIVYPMGRTDNSYTIPDTVENIAESAFYKCLNLKSIKFRKNVKIVNNHAFEFCGGLETVELNEGIQRIGEQAFMDCRNLTGVVVPNTCKYLEMLCFSRCESLRSARLPNGLKTIEHGLFCECPLLSEVFVPDGVLRIESIAFSRCKSLAELELPESVKMLSWDTFMNGNENLIIRLRNSNQSYYLSSYIKSLKII